MSIEEEIQGEIDALPVRPFRIGPKGERIPLREDEKPDSEEAEALKKLSDLCFGKQGQERPADLK